MLYFRQLGPSLAALLFFTAPCYALSAGPATAAVTKPNSLAEAWVREQSVVGEVADLSKRFPQEADRVLRASFLEHLLTDSSQSVKLHRHGVDIRHAIFIGDIDLKNAKIVHATNLKDCRFGNVNLSNSVFEKDISFSRSSFKEATFYSMKVGHNAFFRKAVFAGPVKFRNGDFLAINLSDVTWPQTKDSIQLDGMSYRQMSAGQEKDSWKKLLALADQSAYNADVYATLEAFFKREGQSQYADKVFIAQKWRERRELLRWYTFDYWWNWILYLLVAYGRRPEQALGWSILFLGVGYGVFRRPENMEAQKAEYASETYSPFWYSLGLFLPFVNLYAAEVWRPKKECTRARIYMRVHILLGWALVPIGLASLTGIIK